jgi:cell wall-associated NlpC family hydrolase
MNRFLLLSLLLLAACSSVHKEVRTPAGAGPGRSVTSYAQSLIGVPYRYGGNSPDGGFDCSGFVDHVYHHTLGIDLPRSSDKISHVGQPVGTGELRPGDLVFFDTLRRKFSHVGIYLGGYRFIHAPSSGGRVRTEDMRESYWKKRYNGARRITSRS